MDQIWIPSMSPNVNVPPGKRQTMKPWRCCATNSKTDEDGQKSLLTDSVERCGKVKEDED